MIKEITAKYDAEQIEKKVTQFWEDSDAYRQNPGAPQNRKKAFFC